MALFASKNTVSNWHRHDVSPSIELIESFAEGIEAQAEESIKRFEEQKRTVVVNEMTKINYAEIVDIHQGLDSYSWDLEGIFNEYFPSLQRRSALITIVGFFEHELDKLCFLFQSDKKYKLSLKDINGKGVERSTKYLGKVAGLDVYKNSNEWSHIKRIQKIRNLVVHQDGRLSDHQGNPMTDAINYIEEIGSLDGDKEVILKNGFLLHIIETYKNYFNLLDKSIIKNETA